ncbi:MAG: hypothetical protein HY608_04185 [Planctomycetes bacterium]|nr:hypothetical protein [Planctomycetota bacterium]
MSHEIAPPTVLILCRDCRRVRQGRRWVALNLPAHAEKLPALLCPPCRVRREAVRRTA